MGQRGENWNETDDKILLEMVKAKKSWLAIGLKLKRNMEAVRQRYRKLVRSEIRMTDN